MTTEVKADTKLATYQDLARQLRIDSIRCSTAAGSGHPTSSLSAADLIAVLLAGHLREPAQDAIAIGRIEFNKPRPPPSIKSRQHELLQGI